MRDDLGDCPASLVGPGREFWTDAVAHLKATGRASRVYRHPLLLVCRLIEDLPAGEVGLNRADAIRRWLHELTLTPAAAQAGTEGAPEAHGEKQNTGKARILEIISRRQSA